MAKKENSKDILTHLNNEQRKAVTATEGPVLIVAGAGTGKTRVITTRVAHLLKTKKDLKPENILALTFTDKATDEMQERVESMIGEDAGDMWIFTFHAFARKILAENGSHIGIPANFNILNDVKKWIILKKLLPDFKLEYYLQLADPAGVLKGFVNFISRAKDELILPEEYLRYAEGLRKSFEKDKKGLESQERKARELEVKREEEVARIYNIYQERSLQDKALDFGDLIIYTIKLFKERPNILSMYQKQFKYIVVDEFQDTNIAQIELLHMLSAKHKNVCVVGDDDQAIYRFRGASYASFLKFKDKFPELKTIKLTQNYRSSGNILESAGRLITHNGVDRYDPDKNLWTEKGAGPAVKVLVAHEYRDEAKAVSDEIEALYRSFKGENKRYSNIAVLYRAHMHKDILLRELKNRGIPVSVVRGVGLFQTEEIRDLVAYLKIVIDPSDSVSLTRVLTLSTWDIDIEDLITISNMAARREVPVYEIIKDPQALHKISKKAKRELKEFREDLKELMRIAKREDAAELFRALIERSGYISSLQKVKGAENEQKIFNISKLFRFIIDYLKNNNDQSLAGFLSYLDFYMQASGDEDQEDISVDEDAIRLMTIHSAKGLEFPYVFLISLVQNRFPTMKRRQAIPFPDSLMKERLPQGDFHKEEERRLCYVAMTRAQKALFLSCIDKSRNRPSIFLKEIMIDKAMESGSISYTDIALTNDVQDRISELLDRFKVAEEKKGKRFALPKPKKLSFTQLDTFRKCPMQYKFSYIYRIPRKIKSHLTFGTNVHTTLEDFFTHVQKGEEVNQKALLELFDRHWHEFKYESRMDAANYRKTGERCLKVFFEKHKDMLHKPPLYLEKKIDLKVGDFVLDVRIDRIDDLGGNKIEVIDYKTGKEKDESYADEDLQLSIYGLACKEVLKLDPVRLSFYYVKPNKKVSTVRSNEDFEGTKKIINDIGSKILAEKFEPKPGQLCKWCDYKGICPAWDKR